MRPTLLSIAVGLVLAGLSPAAQSLKVTERTLPNGMRFLFVEKHNVPTVAAGWVARVGSANERPGTTGISHMLEHMMKKGTTIIGTTDPVKDARLIAEQDRVQAEIRKEMSILRERRRRGDIDDTSAPEVRTPRLRQLRDDFNRLVAEQRPILVKEELATIYAREGAAGRNAMTNPDLTAYVVTVPANKLELWCWLESDRLQNPVLREFYSERDVVLEERRQTLESAPTGLINEAFQAMMWTAHPYHWSVVGWKSDIGQVTREQAEEHFRTFYAPHNLTAVLVGDLVPDVVWPMIERYFGRIPRSDRVIPELVTEEPPQMAEQRMLAEADATPVVEIHYKTVARVHRDYPALRVLTGLLSGRSGRLHKELVVAQKVATGVGGSAASRKYAGEFVCFGNPAPGRHPEEVESAIYQQVVRLQRELVAERELQTVKNQVEIQTYTSAETNITLMLQLAVTDATGSYRDLLEMPDRLREVTREEVQRVARRYFTRENRSVLIVNRKAGAAENPKTQEGR